MAGARIEDGVLGVAVRETREGEVVVLSPRDSSLSYAAAEEIRQVFRLLVSESLAAGRRRFVLDLSETGLMDSCGLAVLISLKKQVEGGNGRLALSNPSPPVRKLFELTRLDLVFDLHEVEADAIRSL